MAANAKKAIVWIMFFTVCSKLLGFARDVYFSSKFGASVLTDSYLLAQTIPNLIFASIAYGAFSTYIPVYSKVQKDNGRAEALGFTNNLLNIVITISIIFSILGIIFTENIVALIAQGFNEDAISLTSQMTKLFFPTIIVTGIGYIIRGYLQINNFFLGQSILGLVLNFTIITSIFLSDPNNIQTVAYGFILGSILELMLILLLAVRKGYKYQPVLKVREPTILKTYVLMAPVLLGTGLNQINAFIDRLLASTLKEGSISALNYAQTLTAFLISVFAISLATVLYPKMSRLAVSNDILGLKRSLINSLSIISAITIPIIIIIIILAYPIIQIVFERGMFGTEDTKRTSLALVYLAVSILGISLREIIVKVFFALHDTKTPLINTSIAVVLNIILNLILIKPLGIGGLALAASLSSVMCSILLLISLQRKIGDISILSFFKEFFKVISSSILMGIFLYLMYKMLFNLSGTWLNQILILVTLIVLSLIVYILLLALHKSEGIVYAMRIILRSLRI
ncbi:murein biosynthesis integral membrane protein MurJ [Paenibacillus agaridevorans]|uniref:murein biosynthesis integral membrane protein MurJ n=1 Tax=Paenibacillus agaridevorans TaxID=171404 RepID=UPI001BE4AE83|nr:murein biosynthesis integral membrane protein MurJ [Paenibacillus agaridevorans]